MTMVNIRKWRMKLPTRRRLEIKILVAKQFPERISFKQEQTLNTAKLSELIPDTSCEKQYLVILIVNNFLWKLIDAYGVIQKVRSLETSSFYVPVRFTCTPPPSQSMFALVSYPAPPPPPPATLMTLISNKKSGGGEGGGMKREKKINFFVNST